MLSFWVIETSLIYYIYVTINSENVPWAGIKKYIVDGSHKVTCFIT